MIGFIDDYREWYRTKGLFKLFSETHVCRERLNIYSNTLNYTCCGDRLYDVIYRNIKNNNPSIIAEYKRASPLEVIDVSTSLRDFYHDLKDHVAAFSIHVDDLWFMGSPKQIEDLRSMGWRGPLLAKGFVFYKHQIDLYRICGASTVLLIYKALSISELIDLYEYSHNRGIEPLIEVDSINEAESTINLINPRILGVNSRDLKTLKVDRDKMISTIRYLKKEYPDIVVIAESGIRSINDLAKYLESGADSLLIGTILMKNSNFRREIANYIKNTNNTLEFFNN